MICLLQKKKKKECQKVTLRYNSSNNLDYIRFHPLCLIFYYVKKRKKEKRKKRKKRKKRIQIGKHKFFVCF